MPFKDRPICCVEPSDALCNEAALGLLLGPCGVTEIGDCSKISAICRSIPTPDAVRDQILRPVVKLKSLVGGESSA